MFRVTAKKTFYSGNLKGSTVPFSVSYPSKGMAEQAQDGLLKQATDLFGALVRYTEVKIEAVRP